MEKQQNLHCGFSESAHSCTTLGWFLFLAGVIAACAAPQPAPDYRAALTNRARPENERALDTVRRPDAVMAFYGVKRGDKVGEIFAARGYYTAILSQLVGADGMVYAVNPSPRPELHERVKKNSLANVRVLEGSLAELPFPPDQPLDFVFIHLNYHDLPAATRGAMNKRVFAALKPGGSYGIVDHSAREGRGDQDAKTLHRIDKALVIQEVTDAGFKLASEGTMLTRADDTRDFSVTKVRDRSDRFALRFQKP
jgi:predicted methyltransferase